MEAIILAGGFGTRLKKLKLDVPKPMVQVQGKPFLEYLLSYLKHSGTAHVVLSVGYKGEMIREYFGEEWKGMKLTWSCEGHPLGTGGGVKKAMALCTEDQVWVLNGDTFFDVNLEKMFAFHVRENSFFTLAGKQMKAPGRYGLIRYDRQHRILAFEEKNPETGEGVINGGIYLIRKDDFLAKPLPEAFSMEHDFLEVYVGKDKFMLYLSDGYFIDIGIPEDLVRAQNEYEYFRKYE
ncbi:MAG: nucleotidyltransferase family protein [Bacteroidales bacterium]|nr:nucleotidyltransferase family protein [Bacteroidales bacterium]